MCQVGLAGPSGSGKTAFSEKVQDFMPGADNGRLGTILTSFCIHFAGMVVPNFGLLMCRLLSPIVGQLQ